MSKRRTLLEWGKNLLILLLICSAAWLFVRAQSGNLAAGWLPDALTALLPGGGTASPPTGTETLPDGAIRPVRIVLLDEAQSARRGVQYSAESDVLFESVGGLLAEALSSAEPPRAVSGQAFRAALNRTSIYFDFLGHLPLPSLCLWLSHVENTQLPSCLVRRLTLSLSVSGDTALYYINETDGLYYTCNLTSDLSARLRAAVASTLPNRAQFAFEAGEAFAGLAPYTLLLPEPPAPTVYSARSPLGSVLTEDLSAPTEQLLLALGFNPQIGGVYRSADGLVVREGAENLLVSNAGVVFYRAPAEETGRYPAADPVYAARALVEPTAGILCGAARIYLQTVETVGTRTTVRFGYLLDGAAVVLPAGAAAAEVVIENGTVTEFTLRLRTYESADVSFPILPELQAVAALEALNVPGDELLLRYEDVGQGLCTPGWGV